MLTDWLVACEPHEVVAVARYCLRRDAVLTKSRLLTPTECARLQGVNDSEYQIDVPGNQALFGFGDAICVPVVQWIVENYLNPLASEMMRGNTTTTGRI